MMLPMSQGQALEEDVPCCGPPAGPPSRVDEQPGYTLCDYVDAFLSTPAGSVPRIKTDLDRKDRMGTLSRKRMEAPQ